LHLFRIISLWMAKLFRLITVVQRRKLDVVLVLLFAVFLLAGGFSALDAYVYGAKSYEQYTNASLAPLFGGCIFVGGFGLMYAYKNRGSKLCLVGLFITVFCYGFMEYLYQATGAI
jgi:hypothetical protein